MFELLTWRVSHRSQLEPQYLLKPKVHLCPDIRGSQALQTRQLVSFEERCTPRLRLNQANKVAAVEDPTSQWMHDRP